MSRRVPNPDAPAPEGEAPTRRERGWRPYWASETTIRDQQRYWLGVLLATPLSALPPDVAAAHLEQLAADVRSLGLDAAIERFVNALVPVFKPTNQPDVR